MITSLGVGDADLKKTIALPAAASTSVVTASLDLGVLIFKGVRVPGSYELVVTVPPLSTTIVPDTRTVTLSIEESVDSAFTSPNTLATAVLTGAGGVGLPAGGACRATHGRQGLQYVRGKVTFGASTTSGAAFTATFSIRA